MKKLSLFFAFALLLVASITSCKKEPVPNGGNNEQPSDTIVPPNNDTIVPHSNDTIIPPNDDTIVPQGNSFIFGHTEGMIVTNYENVNPQYQNGQYSYSIDLNGDGINDISLVSKDVGSAGLGHAIVSSIKCLENYVELSGETFLQEQYKHSDTNSWYYVDPDYPEFDSIHVFHIIQTYTCDRISENDIVESTTEKLLLNAFNEGDELDLEGPFSNAEVYLKNRSYYIGYEPTGWGTPTLTHLERYYLNNCDYFPLDEVKYIGFRISKNGNEHFGWLKLILADNGYNHFVRVFETAIQE